MQLSEYREILKEELALVALNYKEIFTISEAAKYLGLTDDYIRKLCQKGKIKSSKPNGKTVYIHRNDIINYAMNRTDNTVEEEAKKQAQQYILKKKLKKESS